MKRGTRAIHDAAASPWAVLAGTIASVSSFCWVVYDKIIATVPGALSIFVFVVCITFFTSVGVYSAVIRRRVGAFQNAMKRIHRINHDYRDVLHATFHSDQPDTEQQKLLRAEEHALRSVCQQINGIFESLVGRSCMVTIKLITKQSSGARHCSTYIRSEENCERDREEPGDYVVGKWNNTAFDQALLPSEAGRCSHFFAPNLTSEKNYNNERQHWERFYRSVIVVPIRSITPAERGVPDQYDDVGFLCVDTMSRNRLNGSYHVEILSAFADQMYNFLSLMRRKYTLTN